jgi:large subunit ribosomal protein L18
MKKGNIFTVPFRRKRQGRTYYKKRFKILMSNKPRFVVRTSLRDLHASLIEYQEKGDKVIFTINSKDLAKLGWKSDSGNVPSAYLIGLVAGKKALSIGIKNAIFDIGLNKSIKGSRLYAALAGAVDSGLNIPYDKSILPSKERISGEHIAKYANELKNDQTKYKKQFSQYLKRGINPEEAVKHFNDIKDKVK